MGLKLVHTINMKMDIQERGIRIVHNAKPFKLSGEHQIRYRDEAESFWIESIESVVGEFRLQVGNFVEK